MRRGAREARARTGPARQAAVRRAASSQLILYIFDKTIAGCPGALGHPVLLGGHQGQLAVGPIHGEVASPAGRPVPRPWRGPSAPHAHAVRQQQLLAPLPRGEGAAARPAQGHPRHARQRQGCQRAGRGAACCRPRAAPQQRGVGPASRSDAGLSHQIPRRWALGWPGGEERVAEAPGAGALEVAVAGRSPVGVVRAAVHPGAPLLALSLVGHALEGMAHHVQREVGRVNLGARGLGGAGGTLRGRRLKGRGRGRSRGRRCPRGRSRFRC
mmetsp:Transcript_44166/g.114853  ORF Transcript_44166/g.114853 Transcript_44166/m.114853 type:complete len:270 (-) Transcript_44166:1035-1844(-)